MSPPTTPMHRIVYVIAVTLLAPSAGVAASVSGHLVGEFAAWGPSHVEAYATRDLTEAPVGSSVVGPDGTFSLDLPPLVTSVHLCLWPDAGAPYPWLLRALPVPVPSADLLVSVTAPPSDRAARQSRTTGSWALTAGLFVSVALGLLLLRRWLARARGGADRGLPVDWADVRFAWCLVALVPMAALGAYAIYAIDEPFDLLEYTYFQEAFAGRWPWEVATAPVVAERAHAPGFAVLLWFVTRLGQSEAVVRTVSLLAHLGAGAVVYRLTAGASGRRSVGVVAALLTLLTPLALRYARDGTPYALVGLLSVLSTALLDRALASNDRRTWIRYALIAALSFYVHYFTAFLVAGQALAVVSLWAFGGRGPKWSARAANAAVAFGLVLLAGVVWGPEVVRAFAMSAEDNQVTQAVYPVAPSFLVFVAEHLRVLFAAPSYAPWLAVPIGATCLWGWTRLLRERVALAVVLIVPFALVGGLLATIYWLHVLKFGGRVYFGWRWLMPYVTAVTIPIAWLWPSHTTPLRTRVVAGAAVALAVVLVLVTGPQSVFRRERPAQDVAAERLLAAAEDGDAIGVLPAPFYTVGWSYILHGRSLDYIHPGPSIWDYYGHEFGDGSSSHRVFGPIRSFGLPLESLATHGAIRRLWVTVFRERLFEHPEFDEAVTDGALELLDARYKRLKRLIFPFMDLVLYEVPRRDPWTGGTLRVETARLYRSLAWLPSALDPDYLLQTFRGEAPIDLRLPPPGVSTLDVVITGLPAGAAGDAVAVVPMPRAEHPGEARLQPPPIVVTPITGESTDRRFRLSIADGRDVELRLERSDAAVAWPLVLAITPDSGGR